MPHSPSKCVDLNCDMGELPGGGHDAELLEYVSSANIACGYHAGDAESMRRTVRWAMDLGVAIGAHPSFADREGFGRREMTVAPDDVYELVRQQITELAVIARIEGTALRHVKPHGALYNMAAKDRTLAAAIARAVRDSNPSLVLYGLSGSFLISEAKSLGLRTASEVFADRTYRADGSLTPRSEPDAMIEDEGASLRQVLDMLDGGVRATDGSLVPIVAETICLHGDQPDSVAFARHIREALMDRGVAIEAPR